MSKPRDYHNAPLAHPSAKAPESVPPLTQAAQSYAPKGVGKESRLATMARVAVRLIDRATGRAFSADELIDRMDQRYVGALMMPYDGEPDVAVTEVAASGTMVFSDQPTALGEIEVGGITLVMVDESPGEGEVLIGASLPDTLDAIVVALSGHADVDVVSDEIDTLTFTAKVAGSSGNLISMATSDLNITPSNVTLEGGIDFSAGTPAPLGRIATDGTDVWTAMIDDVDGTNPNTWVKTFTGTP